MEFLTQDRKHHYIDGTWDLLIAHPPCTYLTVSGNAWFNENKYAQLAKQRYMDRADGIAFFLRLATANAKRIAIENPVGIMSNVYRKPDQIIQPWQYGHHASKATCLWLKNLPLLKPTHILEKPKDGWENMMYKDGKSIGFNTKDENGKCLSWNDKRTAKERSKTFHGIAQAMAEQYGILTDETFEQNDSKVDENQLTIDELLRGDKKSGHKR